MPGKNGLRLGNRRDLFQCLLTQFPTTLGKDLTIAIIELELFLNKKEPSSTAQHKHQ
jgi:hypothetical protein